MMAVVRMRSAGVQELLDGGSGVAALLRSKAEPVRAAAAADPHDDSGEYEASIRIEEGHTDRMVLRVIADVPYAMKQEARYGVLVRALDAAR